MGFPAPGQICGERPKAIDPGGHDFRPIDLSQILMPDILKAGLQKLDPKLALGGIEPVRVGLA
jgi:hypothetical protein